MTDKPTVTVINFKMTRGNIKNIEDIDFEVICQAIQGFYRKPRRELYGKRKANTIVYDEYVQLKNYETLHQAVKKLDEIKGDPVDENIIYVPRNGHGYVKVLTADTVLINIAILSNVGETDVPEITSMKIEVLECTEPSKNRGGGMVEICEFHKTARVHYTQSDLKRFNSILAIEMYPKYTGAGFSMFSHSLLVKA